MRGVERVHRIAQTVFLTHGAEQAGCHASAQNGTHQCIDIAFFCANRQTRKCNAQVVLFDFLRTNDNLRCIARRFDDVAAAALHLGEQIADKLNVILCKRTCDCNNRIFRTVVFIHVLVQGVTGHFLQAFFVSENRASQRKAVVARLKDFLRCHVLRRVFVHVDFFENNAALQL